MMSKSPDVTLTNLSIFINPQRNMVKLGTTRNTTKACLVLDAGMSFAFTKESDGVNLEINLNIVINMIS